MTGERVVILRGDEDKMPGQAAVAHLTVSPHGALAGEHVHPHIEERFAVISGTLGTRIAGVEQQLTAGEQAAVAPGVPHDWWNSGEGEASVIVEVDGPEHEEPRFEAMIATMFGLANDGRTNPKGMPGLLQLALIGREFGDVIRFTKPPPRVQGPIFAVLGTIGRRRGMSGIYPAYLHPHGRTAPDPEALARSGIAPPTGGA